MGQALEVPAGFDPAEWIGRWDRMQEHYLPRRDERLRLLAWLVGATQECPALAIDLGCGTGSVMATVLEACPTAQAVGIDLDDSLLLLAEHRLCPFGDRARLLRRDLRDPSWTCGLDGADAIVSATALHWLAPEELASLYRLLAAVLKPGGLFANADHVGSPALALQAGWEAQAEREREADRSETTERWAEFWQAYGEALGEGLDPFADRQATLGPWRGVEQGMPRAWHLGELRSAGFTTVECFWRHLDDAIYGGLR